MELKLRIVDEHSARIYAVPLCGCVEEAAERARGSRPMQTEHLPGRRCPSQLHRRRGHRDRCAAGWQSS
jgi:hypothetical protein